MPPATIFWPRVFSRRGLLIGIAVFAVTTLLVLLTPRSYAHLPRHTALFETVPPLHVAIFATSGNYHLCQLHTSAAVMGYPAFTLLNWDDHEDDDELKQHLAKIDGALRWLNDIPDEQQDELVFMADGYDLWFQLPHEYIIKRYYDVVAMSDRRHVDQFGEALVRKHDIRNTVIFGPDKQCAPMYGENAFCWAIPDSWMDAHSFGPDTDYAEPYHTRPKWLNSGTIVGPVRELRHIFERALEESKNNHRTDMDQYYFASIFGLQSYGRRLKKLGRDRELGLDTAADEEFLRPTSHDPKKKETPDVNQRWEWHIGLDWSSNIFQTAGFYADYITWIRHNDTSEYTRLGSLYGNYHHHFVEQEDLAGTGPGNLLSHHDPALAAWITLPLATNTASRNTPAVMHINGKKGYRLTWWPRMWFFPFLEHILADLKGRRRSTLDADRKAYEGARTFNKKGPGWIDWAEICGKYEDRLLGKSDEPD
ncbi:hypothetical protein MBLNU230_g4305t1 [Neophaeotheca triangularis]